MATLTHVRLAAGVALLNLLPTIPLAAQAAQAHADDHVHAPAHAHAAERSLSFLVVGDWGFRGENAQRAIARRMGIVAQETDSRFVISTGDNFYYDGVQSVDDTHWQESFERIYTAKSLQRPWYVTLGNHDYNGNVRAQIDYTKRSERWKLPDRYYTVVQPIDDTTSVRFLFLDTQLLDSATAAIAGVERKRQLVWLDSTLSASTSQWDIVVGHHPMYTGSRAGNSPRLIGDLRPILEKHGVQVYIAGHDHDMQHLRPPGTTDYFVSGAAAKPRESGTTAHTLFAIGNVPGIMAVALTPRQMQVRFVDSTGKALYRTSFERKDLRRGAAVDGRFPPSARPDRVMATWKGDPTTSLAVTWRTAIGARNGVAQIAPATASPRFVADAKTISATSEILEADDGPAQHHSAAFTDLKPSTLYAYRVGDGEIWSEWYQLRTASTAPEPFSFIYLGDAQNDLLSLWSRALRGAFTEAPKARFILHAGDLVNRGTRDREWGEWFAAGGWIQAMMPSIPVPGNHEYEPGTDSVRRLTKHWRAQFTLPENGPPGLEESVYYTDYQGVRIVALNSNERLAEQAKWLDAVLAKNPNRWTVVTFHHPVFSTAARRDNPEVRRLWKPLFDRYNVDLVLQGHDHTYGRGRNMGSGLTVKDREQGTVYAVSVSGPKMYALGDSTEWMDRRAEDTQLYQIVHVATDTLRYEARTVAGELYDAFDLVKRAGKTNELLERLPAGLPERRHPPAPPR